MDRFIFMLLLSLSAAAVQAETLPAAGVLLDSYAAIVNGKVITVGEVLSALQPMQEQLAVRYNGRELDQKILEQYEAIRDALVESELILLDFEMQGGALPDRAIEDHVNNVIHDRFGNDRTAFLKALANERLTFAEWRKQMKEQLTVQMLRQREVSAKILITPLDLQAAYDQRRESFSIPERVRLRTLSIAKGDIAKKREEARSRAIQIRDRLLAGETTFAAAVGEDATFQEDAEPIETSSLNETLRSAIADLQPDGISGPLEIGDRLYLVQLVERQPAHLRPFDEVAPEIERELRRAEFERLNRTWIDSLRSKYYIQLFSHNLFD